MARSKFRNKNKRIIYIDADTKRQRDDDDVDEQSSSTKKAKTTSKQTPFGIIPGSEKAYGGIVATVPDGIVAEPYDGGENIENRDLFWMLWSSFGDTIRLSIHATMLGREIQEFPDTKPDPFDIEIQLQSWFFILKYLNPTFRWIDNYETFVDYVRTRINMPYISWIKENKKKQVRVYAGQMLKGIGEDGDAQVSDMQLESEFDHMVAQMFGLSIGQEPTVVAQITDKRFETETQFDQFRTEWKIKPLKRFYDLFIDLDAEIARLNQLKEKIPLDIKTSKQTIADLIESYNDIQKSEDLSFESLESLLEAANENLSDATRELNRIKETSTSTRKEQNDAEERVFLERSAITEINIAINVRNKRIDNLLDELQSDRARLQQKKAEIESMQPSQDPVEIESRTKSIDAIDEELAGINQLLARYNFPGDKRIAKAQRALEQAERVQPLLDPRLADLNDIKNPRSRKNKFVSRKEVLAYAKLLTRLYPGATAAEQWAVFALNRALNVKKENTGTVTVLSELLNSELVGKIFDSFANVLLDLFVSPLRGENFDLSGDQTIPKDKESFEKLYAQGYVLLDRPTGDGNKTARTELGNFVDNLRKVLNPMLSLGKLTTIVEQYPTVTSRSNFKFEVAAAPIQRYFQKYDIASKITDKLEKIRANIAMLRRSTQRIVFELEGVYYLTKPNIKIAYTTDNGTVIRSGQYLSELYDDDDADKLIGYLVLDDDDGVTEITVLLKENPDATFEGILEPESKDREAALEDELITEQTLELQSSMLDTTTFIKSSVTGLIWAIYELVKDRLKLSINKTKKQLSPPNEFVSLISEPVKNTLARFNPDKAGSPQRIVAQYLDIPDFSFIRKEDFGDLIQYLYHDEGVYQLWTTQLACEVWMWIHAMKEKFCGVNIVFKESDLRADMFNSDQFAEGNDIVAEFIFGIQDETVFFGDPDRNMDNN